MKKVFKVILPILLAIAIVLCLLWYLFVYDRAFTRDMLLYGARYFDRNNKPAAAAWFYDLAYNQSVDSDEVAIELAHQHKLDGNYTQAEVILSQAIEDGGSTALYTALCRTYVEQDKILDAVKLLNSIPDHKIREEIDALRPASPSVSHEPGLYNQYISVINGTTMFHTSWYYVQGNHDTLSVSAYNTLGTSCTNGDIVLNAITPVLQQFSGRIEQVVGKYQEKYEYRKKCQTGIKQKLKIQVEQTRISFLCVKQHVQFHT
jgi:hypothetical protein